MAGTAVRRRALENLVLMTLTALEVEMRTGQLEGGCIVIERGGFPTVRGVAGPAVGAQLPLVGIILLVTFSAGR